jgi:hypothetical protein
MQHEKEVVHPDHLFFMHFKGKDEQLQNIQKRILKRMTFIQILIRGD